MKKILPIELINKILIFRPRHPNAEIINTLFINRKMFIDRWIAYDKKCNFTDKKKLLDVLIIDNNYSRHDIDVLISFLIL